MTQLDTRSFDEHIRDLCAADPRFSRETYEFCYEVLDFTMKTLAQSDEAPQRLPVTRHISAQELLDGLRDYALQEFGPMARLTLKRMGVASCGDVGDVVFNLVNAGLLGKQPRDRREDFNAGYDFETAFSKPFRPASTRKQNKRNTP